MDPPPWNGLSNGRGPLPGFRELGTRILTNRGFSFMVLYVRVVIVKAENLEDILREQGGEGDSEDSLFV